ncbi:MAG: DUF4405 domain-containing protein [Opitutales bacterium]|nr:DUF4405 domain-containing protein [Opitutales bacterium]
MNRSLLNLTIDLLAAVCLLVMAASGYVLRFPLPPSTNRTHELWSLSRHEWGTIHSWASLGLLAILVVHVALHWQWIVTMISRRFTHTRGALPVRPWLAGVVTVAALIALIGSWAAVTHLGVRERDIPLHLSNEPLEKTESESYSSPATVASGAIDSPHRNAVDLWRDVMVVFEASCISCHGPNRQLAEFRVDRRDDFYVGRSGKVFVVPNDPEASWLLPIVSGEVSEMKSAEAHRLAPEDIALVKAWILEGADWPDNRAEGPLNP